VIVKCFIMIKRISAGFVNLVNMNKLFKHQKDFLKEDHNKKLLVWETGTGKTYVYLRTAYELRKRYGFRKFIVIVPSIAIYEGVIKSIEITREHFKSLYSNEYMSVIAYDSDQISKLRDFANSQFLQMMIMTMASFNRYSNNIYKRTIGNTNKK